MSSQTTTFHFILLSLAALFLFSSCAKQANPSRAPEKMLRIWCHQGQEAENQAMRDMVKAFNEKYRPEKVHAEITFFPDFQYTERVSMAAGSSDLPDVLDLDGPLLAQFVKANIVQPLDEWISAEERADFLPTIIQQGTIDNKLYALGAFDSAVVIYYDKGKFKDAGVVVPPEGKPWTWEEWMNACAKLKAKGIEPVAMHFNESADEWYTYAFSPVIWSGGGSLISEDGNVDGVLNSPSNIKSLRKWQEIFTKGYASTDPVDPDPFGHGKTAMDWTGHWMARSHIQKKGDQLGVMPLPLVGDKPSAPCGSWCWSISSKAADPRVAMLWIHWVTDPETGIKPIVTANGAVPARLSAFALFPEYDHPPFSLFRTQLEHWARPRPRTPFYATLTQRFASALRDIARGQDVAVRLNEVTEEASEIIHR